MYPRPIFAFQALPVQTSAPIARNDDIRPLAADRLYCIPLQVALQLIPPFSPAQAGESLVTLPLQATLQLIPPYLNKTWVGGQKDPPTPIVMFALQYPPP
jgi:hypothetical protein